ncbi:2'-5' RNA ligase family protein [Streptomyces sp. NBC_00038]|uniref:2'-5' RNA ligase family protein n=1 Tax=Streptomyces sp. NBC_00038 TaxID=2903615 RepID=UPI002254843E|nr:2'-5' RNA ligase family protein [Streptomyces sp. NBC_00038]MCX5555407.1 2'-5' RNA ligase family protein [Streptomyces sp. NBC_00038]
MMLAIDPRAFPPAPPSDPNDPGIISAHDWDAFFAVDEMVNHWDRPGWTSTTRAYYWMLTFPDAIPLIGQARHCQRELRHLGFDEIDEDGFHLTLSRIGLAKEISSQQLERLVANAFKRDIERFTLQAIPLTASRGAIRYSIAPWHPVLRLHAALAAAGIESRLPMDKPTTSLRPHVGLAYCNQTMPAREVRTAILPFRSLDAVELNVHQAQIVELRREHRAYRWQVVHTLPLR